MAFSSKKVMKITEIGKERLQDWQRRGFIKPSIRQGTKPGKRSLWSRNDLYSIATFKKITESGLSRAVVAEILSEGGISPSISDEEVDSFNILLHFRSEKGKVFSVLMTTMVLNFEDFFDQDVDMLLVVNFKKIKAEIDSRIEAIQG